MTPQLCYSVRALEWSYKHVTPCEESGDPSANHAGFGELKVGPARYKKKDAERQGTYSSLPAQAWTPGRQRRSCRRTAGRSEPESMSAIKKPI